MMSKGVISLQNDRGTSYAMYISVQNELARAFNELKEEMAWKHFHKHLDQLHEGGDNGDEEDETQKTEVHVCETPAQPAQRTALEDELVQQVVDRQRAEQHEDDREAQAIGRFYVFRYRQVRTHTQEVCENHIVNED